MNGMYKGYVCYASDGLLSGKKIYSHPRDLRNEARLKKAKVLVNKAGWSALSKPKPEGVYSWSHASQKSCHSQHFQ